MGAQNGGRIILKSTVKKHVNLWYELKKFATFVYRRHQSLV
ncbi:hypothetical protein HMPREF0645_0369 [Hallella bergensis DSM 17361]|uniref:Uncharacterized protein n=1 Tax=Hallella bergensis DSM 17361 TaxID=585502 RepID=D1PTT4_9BACT|nr:hypothetical protein HMPREF0645_0369 [Hallella bergensis DSM 17361]